MSKMKVITYQYLDDNRRAQTAYWEGERAEALDAAIAHLHAEQSESDASSYIYEEDGSKWAVDEDALVVLGAALLGHGDRGDVYSLWCAAHPAREVSGKWVVEDRDGRRITSREELPADAFALDESDFEVEVNDLFSASETLADSGYFGRDGRRIAIYASASAEEDGESPIAYARWEEER